MTDLCDRLLPDGAEWDSAFCLPCTMIDGHPFHTMWIAADYACALVEAATPECLTRAECVLRALAGFQDADPASPSIGNFRWEHEDPGVEDLNAVVFFAIRIVPLLHRHRARLSADLLDVLLPTVRRALGAIESINVGPEYTNIISQSVAALIVGGQLLDDPDIIALGSCRFREWVSLVDESGLAHEFNSPVYTQMTVSALRAIEDLSADSGLRAVAAQVRLRQILSVALHINSATGRMSAPHCRAYFPFLVAETPPDIDVLKDWVARGWAPDWMLELCRADKGIVRETSDRARGVHLTSFHGAGYSVGTASRELDTQNNRYIAAQTTAIAVQFMGKDKAPGTLFCKYVWNDEWLGDYATAPSRPSRQVFFDHGAFLGVQDGPRMIGAYRPRRLDAWNRTASAKTCLVVADARQVGAVWVKGQKLPHLPAEIDPTAAVTLDLGNVHVVLKPLSSKELQPELPNRLVERDGMLVFEIPDYLGPARTFWNQAKPGAFFQGHIRAGFYAEVFPSSAGIDPSTLATLVDSGLLTDESDPPIRPDQGVRNWTLAYARGEYSLGMKIDLHNWRRLADWTGVGPIGLPMLESSLAKQSCGGRIDLGGATLIFNAQPAWLVALPDSGLWAASVHPGDLAGPIRLQTPGGSVELRQTRGATILWQDGKVWVDHTAPGARISVEGGNLLGAT
ncbi:hypothetical protein CLV78_10610 [Aliiruegeria haliotis]|uniref:Heparinase II/III-like protein n=1 Tax=Aliiruegeria haliotis TaxID=1280846 RepID=A0A2T0RMW7_9RHOB|nr:hypothetical protein [Aliiruegeria haliotis]PRY22470.1 hypothetical protein CLV78_10610 [Aliiruegeria haliotis]